MSTDLDKLIHLISKLPGLGQRSARRAVLHLIKNKEQLMLPLSKTLQDASDSIKICDNCGNLDTVSPCAICTDLKRDKKTICVVEEVADLWAFERGKIFGGQYHILGGTLSAIDGRNPSDLNIEKLVDRVSEGEVEEVVIATNATVDGQTTAHYVTEILSEFGIKITRLAHGIPIGGELDYLDDGTLGAALKARKAC